MKFLRNIENSKGYIAIETLVVAGLVLGVGVGSVLWFNIDADRLGLHALDIIVEATNDVVVNPVN